MYMCVCVYINMCVYIYVHIYICIHISPLIFFYQLLIDVQNELISSVLLSNTIRSTITTSTHTHSSAKTARPLPLTPLCRASRGSIGGLASRTRPMGCGSETAQSPAAKIMVITICSIKTKFLAYPVQRLSHEGVAHCRLAPECLPAAANTKHIRNPTKHARCYNTQDKTRSKETATKNKAYSSHIYMYIHTHMNIYHIYIEFTSP